MTGSNLAVMLVTLALFCLVMTWGFGRWRIARAETDYPHTGKFIRVGDCRYHYRVEGQGIPVVLLHGAGASLEDYPDLIINQLAANFQVIAIDRPGHGYSERPKGDWGAPVEQACLVHQILTALCIDAAILVGHSWAGAVVLAYALEHPEKTRGLVLLQGTVYRPAARTGIMLKMLALPWLGFWLTHLLMPWTGRNGIRNALARAFAPDPASPHYLARALAMWTRPGQARAIALDARRREATIEALSRRYTQISAPVWMVVGASDQFVDPATQLLRLREELPGAELIMLDQAGHQIPQMHPQAVVDAVRGLATGLGVGIPFAPGATT